jgi:hypothetical protein
MPVPIDEDELAAVEIESTHTVDIEGFVPSAKLSACSAEPFSLAGADSQRRAGSKRKVCRLILCDSRRALQRLVGDIISEGLVFCSVE